MSQPKEPFFVSGTPLDFGLSGNVEIPSLGSAAGRKPCTRFAGGAQRAMDGRIYCVFSQNTQVIWLAVTRDGGRTWQKPSAVMSCPGPGYITDANVLVCPGQKLTVFATYVPDDPSTKTRRSQFLAASSADGGATWSKPEPLQKIAHRYPVGKIHTPIWLDDKTVAMGYSWDLNADLGKPFRDEPGMCIKSGVLISHDGGRTWTPGKDVPDIAHTFGLDEPATVQLSNGDLFMILRTQTAHPCETHSHDGGKTWEPPRPSAFFGYDSPSALLRLRDGAILRAWDNSPISRFPLAISLSTDDAKTWSPPRTIAEPTLNPQGKANFERACYPSLAEAPDGATLAVWWQRTVEGVNSLGYARFNRAWVEEARRLPPPGIIITFGDSVTAAIGRCGVRTCQTYSFLLEARLKASGRNVQVMNAGVGGNDTRHALERLERDVISQRPEWVVVMFGVNDAAMVDGGPVVRTDPRVPLSEYRANMAKVVKAIQAAGAAVVLCTPTPMSRAYAYSSMGAYATHEDMNFLLREYSAAAREVARKTGATLADIFRAFVDQPGGLKFIQDGCHPNAAGQALIAETLLGPVNQLLSSKVSSPHDSRGK